MALPVLHLLTVLSVFSGTFASLSDDYAHFAALDPAERIKLYWTIHQSNQSVSFALEAATTGWVGFGISSGSGMMTGADLVIGWVKDGKPVLTDRFAKGKWIPQIDEHNDYHLTYGEEKNGTTILKFHRKIDTCDKEDIKLKEKTNTKVIFALNDEDPVSPTQMNRHTFRGARSILLNSEDRSKNKPDPSWSTFDMLNRKYEVPAKHTSYHCSVRKIPDLPKKNHIVRFEPVVQPGNEGVVHHIVITACAKDFSDAHVNTSVECNNLANMPGEVLNCRGYGGLAAAWAVGGGPFVYPQHAGLPIGSDYTGRYFVMEVHYDNPDLLKGIIDSSGIRFYYTPNLRKYDAGVLTVGSATTSWLMIPPQQKSWHTTGFCSKYCTEKALASNSSLPEKGIKLFSVGLHSHLSARAAWTQHVRDGVELPEITRNDNYDFNFQTLVDLREEVHFKPGDEIIHHCLYNTMDRTNLTFGGESSREEMCLDFMYYYPLIPQLPQRCNSVDLKAGVAILDKYYPEEEKRNGSESSTVNPFKKNKLIWTPKMTEEYKQLVNDENQLVRMVCKRHSHNIPFRELLKDEYQHPKVKITTPLPAPKDGCDVYSSAVRTSGYVLYQILTITFIVLTQW